MVTATADKTISPGDVIVSVDGQPAPDQVGEVAALVSGSQQCNIAEISAPTGCRTKFTGMRVSKPDGTQFHLIGIQPTILASRTLAGVIAGRDEVLERALVYLRSDAQ